MLHGRSIAVVLPAYRAAATLERTFRQIPIDIVDDIILVDDASDDDTVELARSLGMDVYVHDRNLGYGANQKTCYREVFRRGADVTVMLHPDYQYDPRLIVSMASMITCGVYDVVLGSRILAGGAVRHGMPRYKFIANRMLTLTQNALIGTKLSEFHTGYRAFSREVLGALPLLANSDDFIFDNQMLVQVVANRFTIGEISCPARYFAEASSISFSRSVRYGLGVLATSMSYRLYESFNISSRLFSDSPTLRLVPSYYSTAENRLRTRSAT